MASLLTLSALGLKQAQGIDSVVSGLTCAVRISSSYWESMSSSGLILSSGETAIVSKGKAPVLSLRQSGLVVVS